MRSKGFTLIELLVVIAIIAILCAVLFPVFAKARAKAHEASCQSNLKELAVAILMYADDHDGYGPVSHASGCFNDQATNTVEPGGFCNSGLALTPYNAGWADYYMQDPGTGMTHLVSNWKVSPLWLCNGNGRGTYKMLNGRGGAWHLWQPQGGGERGTVRNVATAGLIGDCWGYYAMTSATPAAVYGYWWQFWFPRDPNDIRSVAPDPNSAYYNAYASQLGAHGNRNNMAFCDGHVKSLEVRAMIDDMDWWVSAFQ